MVKYRLKFRKFGETRFVSHLDLVRLFTRLHTRAHIPLSYSEGFNPHPKMAIALPLSVGCGSEGEYIDVSYDKDLSEDFIKDELNKKVPIGIEITKVTRLNEASKKFASIKAAEYTITIEGNGLTKDNLGDFFARESIEIEKKTKRSLAIKNIKENIYHLEMCAQYPGGAVIKAIISAGNEATLRPDLLISAMEMYIDGFKADYADIVRTKILDGRFEELL